MSDYISYLKELLTAFGEIEFRRMFGAHGIFHHGLMFALLANYQTLEEVLEDTDVLVFWASKSYHVALQQNLK